MTAFARNSADVSLVCRFALRAAVFLVFADRTAARLVSAFVVFLCHKKNPPLFDKI
jgi:hypothetical protein